MDKKSFYFTTIASLIIIFIGISSSQTFGGNYSTLRCPGTGGTIFDSWAFRFDLSNLRCPGGIVSIGDFSRTVRKKCGEPISETCADSEPFKVWVYRFGQSKYIYYFNFVNDRLQRIQSVKCWSDNPDCK